MSTSTWTPPLSPSLGHVILILHHLPDTKLCDSLYLEVPIDIATTICFIGVKYLAYLGFAILNHVGWISKIPRGASVNPSDPFEGIYYFVVPNQSDAELSHSIVNTECIQRANGFSEASAEFLDAVKKLYSACPFTRHTAKFCEATHAFPYARGSDWFNGMIENRRSDKFGAEFSELDPDDLQDIDDVRNGILLYFPLKNESESHLAAILKTPNPALETDDVIEDSTATSNARTCTSSISLQYPANARYTFTWLVRQEDLQKIYGDRLDGMFGSIGEETLPSALVLHYVYGATALERWGRNAEPFMARGRSLTLVRAKAKEAYKAAEALKAKEDKDDEDEDIPITDQLMMRFAYGSKREAREQANLLWRDRMEGWCNDTDVALHPPP